MRVLEQYEPQRVLFYFEEICSIPHGSGNMKQISQYVVDFAKEHGLEVRQDESLNVIIKKPASAGYENRPVVMLQGHMDMVEAKENWSDHDFATDGLRLHVEGDEIFAEGTTLGGDDGIAVAYMLAILEDDTLAHPALECVFTVDEEVGLLGAADIDLTDCRASYLINLDSEDEGVFLSSCAGGMRVDLKLPIHPVASEGYLYEVTLSGLLGGHSGTEIQKEHGNANLIMGRILKDLQWNLDLEWELVSIEGGNADNAIPRSCTVQLLSEAEEAVIHAAFQAVSQMIFAEYRVADPDMHITVRELGRATAKVLTPADLSKLFFLLTQCPNGVQNMSQSIEGLVETSLNLGILSTEEGAIQAAFSLRSSVESRKFALYDRLEFLMEYLGGSCSYYGDYPGWDYKVDSKLRDQMITVWNGMFEHQAEIQAIHAGVECGLFLYQMPELDMVSIGPDMKDIHTPAERLSLSSTERVYRYLVELLQVIE